MWKKTHWSKIINSTNKLIGMLWRRRYLQIFKWYPRHVFWTLSESPVALQWILPYKLQFGECNRISIFTPLLTRTFKYSLDNLIFCNLSLIEYFLIVIIINNNKNDRYYILDFIYVWSYFWIKQCNWDSLPYCEFMSAVKLNWKAWYCSFICIE